MALTVGSTLLGAAGAVQQGQATAAASRYNAQIADMNATLADRRAKDAIDRGVIAEQQKRQQNAAILGKQTAAMAANGVDLSFGSPLDTLTDTATMGELDALTIRTNANREADDYRVQGVNQRATANLNRMQADSAETGGYLKAAGTILGGGGQAYGRSKGLSYVGAYNPASIGSLY
ncbi:virion core protein, T7 gp14 family [Bradyrhizobium elkanii]